MKIIQKTPKEVKLMAEGGKRLGEIKFKLKDKSKEGVNAKEVEDLATKLIKKAGGRSSFKMVPGYSWSTCINVNDGVVHGIPHKSIVFHKNDLVSIDVGMFYGGFHTDTSLSFYVGQKDDVFLESGRKALKAGISRAVVGNRIFDISKAIEDSFKESNLSPVKSLVGHGIGKDLHEDPHIPCFVKEKREKTPEIPLMSTFAIEVMYCEGSDRLVLEEDGWTISTKDGSIAGLFEETVVVTKKSPKILTLS